MFPQHILYRDLDKISAVSYNVNAELLCLLSIKPEGGNDMATATFDRTFVISNQESKQKLIKIMDSSETVKPVSAAPFSDKERKRSEDVLKQFLSRSKR